VGWPGVFVNSISGVVVGPGEPVEEACGVWDGKTVPVIEGKGVFAGTVGEGVRVRRGVEVGGGVSVGISDGFGVNVRVGVHEGVAETKIGGVWVGGRSVFVTTITGVAVGVTSNANSCNN
jgi:hypothetical protein